MAIHTWAAARPNQDVRVSIHNDGSVLATCSTRIWALRPHRFCDHRRGNPGLQPTGHYRAHRREHDGPFGRAGGSTTCPGISPAALNPAENVKN